MAARVLVVDDEMDTLNLLKTILQISGFEPITTLNSVDAITLAETEKPDVVLLDIMMPKLDGFTLCKMMRQNTQIRDLPIIFVTAYEALDIEDRRREAGANMVIQKPIGVELLIQSINDLLKQRADGTATGKIPAPKAAEKPAVQPPDPAAVSIADQPAPQADAAPKTKPTDGADPLSPPERPGSPDAAKPD